MIINHIVVFGLFPHFYEIDLTQQFCEASCTQLKVVERTKYRDPIQSVQLNAKLIDRGFLLPLCQHRSAMVNALDYRLSEGFPYKSLNLVSGRSIVPFYIVTQLGNTN